METQIHILPPNHTPGPRELPRSAPTSGQEQPGSADLLEPSVRRESAAPLPWGCLRHHPACISPQGEIRCGSHYLSAHPLLPPSSKSPRTRIRGSPLPLRCPLCKPESPSPRPANVFQALTLCRPCPPHLCSKDEAAMALGADESQRSLPRVTVSEPGYNPTQITGAPTLESLF